MDFQVYLPSTPIVKKNSLTSFYSRVKGSFCILFYRIDCNYDDEFFKTLRCIVRTTLLENSVDLSII